MNAEDLQKKTTVDVMKYLRHWNHVLRIVTGFLHLPVGSFGGKQGARTSGIEPTQCHALRKVYIFYCLMSVLNYLFCV